MSSTEILVAGAGRDWPTAQEAVLKLREGAFVAAEAHHTEQLLHGHLFSQALSLCLGEINPST